MAGLLSQSARVLVAGRDSVLRGHAKASAVTCKEKIDGVAKPPSAVLPCILHHCRTRYPRIIFTDLCVLHLVFFCCAIAFAGVLRKHQNGKVLRLSPFSIIYPGQGRFARHIIINMGTG
jgi:hypothetical protein